MDEKYTPGALAAFLSVSNRFVTGKKTKKRRKGSEQEQVSTAETSIFDKYDVDEAPELPVVEPVVVPKKAKFDEDYVGSSADQQSTSGRAQQRQNRLKRQNNEKENERTVFVGNAPVATTKKEIHKLFSQFGSIDSVRVRSLIPADKKTSKKVAALKNEFSSKMDSLNFYVKFKNVDSVEKALKMNEEKLGDRKLRVDRCVGKALYNATTTVFVGNTPFDVKDSDLAEFFEKAGAVSFVRVVRDSQTGRGKGFAFVGFKDSSAVPIALGMNGLKFRKNELRVQSIEKKKKRLVGEVNSRTRFGKNKQSVVTKAKKGNASKRRSKLSKSDSQRQSGGMVKKVRKLIKKRKNKKVKKSIMT